MPKQRTPGLIHVDVVLDVETHDLFKQLCDQQHVSVSQGLRSLEQKFVMENWKGVQAANKNLILDGVFKSG